MTFRLRDSKNEIWQVKIEADEIGSQRAFIHFEPFNGTGAGRQAIVQHNDFVELVGENDLWWHIRSVIIDDSRNIRHFDGWVRKSLLTFIRGHTAEAVKIETMRGIIR